MFLHLLEAIDTFLIEGCFQPIVDWFGRHFGINQFQLARGCAYGTWLCFLFIFTSIVFGLIGTLSLRVLLFGGMLGITSALFRRIKNLCEDEKLMEEMESNPKRCNIAGRCVMLTTYVLCFLMCYAVWVNLPGVMNLGLVFCCIFVLAGAEMYFHACDWPPRKRETKLVSQGA